MKIEIYVRSIENSKLKKISHFYKIWLNFFKSDVNALKRKRSKIW